MPIAMFCGDGTVGDATVPVLRADDLGVLRGDGVFETVLVVDRRPRKLSAHLRRLARSAWMLDLPLPDSAAWRRCVDAVCAASPAGELVLKLVLTRGVEGSRPDDVTGFALTMPVPGDVLRQRREGVAVVTLDRGYPAGLGERAPWLLIGAKTLSYAVNMAAVRHAQRLGADDVVFVSSDGWVLEGPTASVVVADGRVLRTPPVAAGLLPGTTQVELFAAAEAAGWSVKSEPLQVDDLLGADAVWLVSSVRLMAAVRRIDGVAVWGGVSVELDGELRSLLGRRLSVAL
jgi:4-amino-4-deoxychorismate lyase